ncbi:response regulator transcription factor [Pseudoduganella namucuonensis]|uniref:DNA-binding response regulator, OmpR family, contains REC and winged-helix (WHTH) domain n=1 Tax=Pseudoduganella namucuonensis TaxID=1035707 RepID=A0A1I7KVE2_9BURK|nr:response regulator transcription factor [Pseudoduganella namucuonensis]SFV01410.1 DNA-binding response regulator, OmpR family, contains REC and winged-helix (wHTH) domain [Pseudoduganella namucuonensis]
MPLHILVVEDHAPLARNLADALEQHGHTADFAADGVLGLRLALEQDYDLVILDLALPGMDGLEVCRQLRARQARRVPVLMLTARDTLRDKLAGFERGADDYLVKPFALEELMARCHALACRHESYAVEVGGLRVDRRSQAVTRDGRPLRLQPVGYRILLALAEAHPRVLTRSELTRKLWGDDPPDSDALRTHLYQLRQALDKPFGRPMLLTVHGVGLRLDASA